MDTCDRHFVDQGAQRVHFARSKRAPRHRESDSTHPSAPRVRFACSKRAPRHSESDLTHPKRAEGSLRMLKMRTAPQRERVRRGFASRSQNVHRGTARAIRPAQSAQRENVHRATARTISMSQRRACHEICSQAHSKCAPHHSESDSTHPKCAEGSLRVLTMCTAPQRDRACHEIQPKRSKVLRLSRKVSLPQTQNHPNCWTCHEIQI